MYYIGIDIAKKRHEVCFLDESGNVLDGNSFNIPNTASGLDKLQNYLDKYGLSPTNSLVGMEATGHYWLVLYSWLIEQGFDVKVINPIVTDAYRNMLIRKTKNDRIDAEVVARVLKMGEYQETSLLDDDTLALRQLCRYRLSQTQTTGDLKRKVIALLDQVFPEYDTLFSDVFGLSSKKLLKNYTTPEEIASIHTRKLANILNKASKGRFGKEKALEIKAVAGQSIGITVAIDAFAFQIRQLIEQIEFVELQIESLDREIASYMDSLDSPITTIPGIGPVYGATILAELGDIRRFPSGKQIVSYAGLDASVHESGDFKGSQARISKRGSAYLRRAIYGAAFIASWSDPELSSYYKRLRARGKHHYVAVGAVARKLCYIIYAVLSENRPFEDRS
ncbi:MAG: IS110 family transposase [bacterium]|jgi:transposase|nr:IS110 family transposase [bacterium]